MRLCGETGTPIVPFGAGTSLEGNAASALGAVYGGATVCAWYPITPSTSLAEAFSKYCERFRVDRETGKKKFAILQAEDELASIGMRIGAHSASAARGKFFQFGNQPAILIEEFFRPLVAHPLFENP